MQQFNYVVPIKTGSERKIVRVTCPRQIDFQSVIIDIVIIRGSWDVWEVGTGRKWNFPKETGVVGSGNGILLFEIEPGVCSFAGAA